MQQVEQGMPIKRRSELIPCADFSWAFPAWAFVTKNFLCHGVGKYPLQGSCSSPCDDEHAPFLFMQSVQDILTVWLFLKYPSSK